MLAGHGSERRLPAHTSSAIAPPQESLEACQVHVWILVLPHRASHPLPQRKDHVMRIVHLSTNMSTARLIGIETYVLNLAAAQKARGSEVMVVTNRLGAFSEACNQHNIPVVVEGTLDRDFPEESVPALVSLFSSFDATIINAHSPNGAVRAFRAGARLGIPCVFTFHISGDDNGRFGDRNPVIEGRNYGMNFSTICVSRINFEDTKKQGVPESEIHYVQSGTAVPGGQTPQPSKSHRPNLIFVGSLLPRKGVDLAILAMVELQRRLGPDCPALNIYGNGDDVYEAHYREMVTVLHLTDVVHFRGFQANILDRCPDSDIFLLPSRSELAPMVILEAMSRGMPIVASAAGDVPGMLPDERYGRVVPLNKIIPIADSIESLLDDIAVGRFDPSLLIERHRSLFTSQKMAERVEAVYKQVLANASAFR